MEVKNKENVFKYNILPYYRCVIKTDKKVDEVINAIREVTIENHKMEQIHDKKKAFTGKIQYGDITLSPLKRLNNNGMMNSFAPKIFITTKLDGDKTAVKIKVRETALSVAVIVIVLLCFISLVMQGSKIWWYSFLFLLCIGIFEFSFWVPCKNAMKIIRSIIE